MTGSRMLKVNRRFLIGMIIVLSTLAVTHGALALAEFGGMGTAKCEPTFVSVKWPMGWARWLGCAMAAHEGLAAGLIGAGGGLFAGWLAYSAIQLQLIEQQSQRTRMQAEAKAAAVLVLAQPIHATASTLMVIEAALADDGRKYNELEKLVNLGVTHTKNTLDHFTISEGVRSLAMDDRLLYITIVGTLASFVNISTNPSPFLPLKQRWINQREILLKLPRYLRPFSTELADSYEKDALRTRNSQAE